MSAPTASDGGGWWRRISLMKALWPVLVLAAVLPARAESPGPADELQACLRDLDADDVRAREAASARLQDLAWRNPQVRKTLREFARSTTSAEARGRALEALSRARPVAVPEGLMAVWWLKRTAKDGTFVLVGRRRKESESEVVHLRLDARKPLLEIAGDSREAIAPDDRTHIELWESIAARFRNSEHPVARRMLTDARNLVAEPWKGEILVRPLYNAAPAYLVDPENDSVQDLEVPAVSDHDRLCAGASGFMVWDGNPRSTRLNRQLVEQLGAEKGDPPPFGWHRATPAHPWVSLGNAPRACCDRVTATSRILALDCPKGCGQFWEATVQQWRVYDPPDASGTFVDSVLSTTGVLARGDRGSAWLSYDTGTWLPLPGIVSHPASTTPGFADELFALTPQISVIELGSRLLLVWVQARTPGSPSHEVSVESAWIVDLSEER